MARNSRLNVWLATTTRNSSKIHWQRSTIRQRTTPCTAGIGPLFEYRGERGSVRAVQTATAVGAACTQSALPAYGR